MSEENKEAAKLFRALSEALVREDINLTFIDAAKAIAADGVEQKSVTLYVRCSIDNNYPMEEYMQRAEQELDEMIAKKENVSPYPY